MQIIVFLNIPFEQFSCNEQTLASSHSVVKMIKKNLERNIDVVESGSSWELIYTQFNFLAEFNPALYCATKLNLDVPNALMATPVRVQLGLHHSQTHFLSNEQLPSQQEIEQINEYFRDEYFLYPISHDQYLLCSNNPMEQTLSKQHWSPELSDFTLQLLTTNSVLRKFHTDVQSWCHSNNLSWNGLYLWGQGNVNTAPEITVKANTGLRNQFLFLHSHDEADKKIFIVDNLSTENELLTECEFHLSTTKNTNIDFVFTDNYSIKVSSRDQMPWLKRIFSRKV